MAVVFVLQFAIGGVDLVDLCFAFAGFYWEYYVSGTGIADAENNFFKDAYKVLAVTAAQGQVLVHCASPTARKVWESWELSHVLCRARA